MKTNTLISRLFNIIASTLIAHITLCAIRQWTSNSKGNKRYQLIVLRPLLHLQLERPKVTRVHFVKSVLSVHWFGGLRVGVASI